MSGVNKFIGIGNLTKDPELRKTPNGNSVTSFSIAVNEKYKDKNGSWKEKCEYINIVVWGKLAELCGQYLSKGKSAYIEGKIATRSWDDSDGKKRYVTEIVANTVQFLSSGEKTSNYNQTPQQQPNYNQSQQQYQRQNQNQGYQSQQPPTDDLPY